MIRAPFKRKPNGSGGAVSGGGGATDTDAKTSKNASSSSSPIRVSLVNLNEDSMSLCVDSDASTSNIYTDIDVCTDSLTNDLITDAMRTSNDFNDFLTADVLKRLFNDSTESITANVNNHRTSNIECNYANESIVLRTQSVSEQNLYEIDNGNGTRSDDKLTASPSKDNDTKENANLSTKYNEFIASIGKSLKNTFSMMGSDDIEMDESMLDGVGESGSNELNATREIDPITSTMVGNSSLTDRLKNKLKTGLKLFKDSKVCFITGSFEVN